jgi:3-dehydroquinate synthase
MPVTPAALADPVRFEVRAGAARYPVEIAAGLLGRLGPFLDSVVPGSRRFIVSSPTVWRLHGTAGQSAAPDEPILLPDGERFKHLATVARIYDALVRAGADRGSVLVAIGGGVLGDVAGFAAATFLRGIPIVQVPTTLLAQVDSAIGGKVGVNHPLGKNLIGAFHQPAAVAADPAVLATLPRREFRAGLYEIVKYGVIASAGLFDTVSNGLARLFARDPAALVPVIADSCRIKASIVEQDEREAGPRRTLNFGHTIGHALEAVTKYRRFRHGEAVAYGMLAAAGLAVRRGALSTEANEALAALVTKMGPLPPVGDLYIPEVLEAARRDKKVVQGRLHFVLPTAIGATAIVGDVTEAELEASLAALGLRR